MSDVFKEPPYRDVVSSHDLWESPEFRALCERFGIAWGLRSMDVKIVIPLQGIVTVEHQYQASVRRDEPTEAIETTTHHNKTWKTHRPA